MWSAYRWAISQRIPEGNIFVRIEREGIRRPTRDGLFLVMNLFPHQRRAMPNSHALRAREVGISSRIFTIG